MKLRTLFLTLAAAPSASMAVDFNFNGGVADWNAAGSWTPAGPPAGGGGNFAIVNSGTATIAADTPVIQDPFIGRGAGTNGTVNQTGGLHNNVGWTFIGTEGGTGAWNVTGNGSLTTGRIYVGGRRESNGGNGSMIINTTGTITAGSDFSVATRGATGSVTMSNGQLNANSWMIIGESNGGVGGTTGTFTQNGGNVNAGATDANARLWLGSNEGGAAVPGTRGEYFLNGGTLAANQIWVGKNYAGVFTQEAGTTFTIRGTGEDSRIGAEAGSSGTYTMNGGILNAAGNFQIGASGQGIFNQSNGTANFSNFPAIGRFGAGNGQANISGGSFNQTNATARLIVGEDGIGTLTVSGSGNVNSTGGVSVGHNATGNGTVQLNAGGTLSAPFVGKRGGAALVNFNGGVIKATVAQAEFFPVLDGAMNPTATPLDAANVDIQAGGAIIDTNGFDIGTGVPFDGIGGLTKQGLGRLTLNGVSTYSGLTRVAGGTLTLGAGSALNGGGGVTVDPGATLDGNGSATGPATIDGTIAPGITSIGTLNFGGVVTLNGATNMEIDRTGAPAADLVIAAGTIDYGGDLDVTLLGGTPQLGDSFNLFDAPSFFDVFATIDLPALPGDYSWQNNLSIDGSIKVIPEASSVTLAGLAALGLLGRRRRGA